MFDAGLLERHWSHIYGQDYGWDEIYYDTDDDQLHLAVVKEDGTVTKELSTYQFNGKYFERVKGR